MSPADDPRELVAARLDAATRRLVLEPHTLSSRLAAREAWWAAVYAVTDLTLLDNPPGKRDANLQHTEQYENTQALQDSGHR